jgi:hypothetical protein
MDTVGNTKCVTWWEHAEGEDERAEEEVLFRSEKRRAWETVVARMRFTRKEVHAQAT